MNGVAIPMVKSVLRASTMAEARKLADTALALSTPEEIEELVREQMGNAYPLDVPLEVSVGYGRSWDAAAH